MDNIIPLPKSNPPGSIHKDIRPISLTPIASKVFESIVMECVYDTIVSNVDPKQFGGLAGTSTTDALFEMTHSGTKQLIHGILTYALSCLILVRRSI